MDDERGRNGAAGDWGWVVKERPILFSGPMIRALLAGTKTQTRRIVKPQPPIGHAWAGWCVTSTHRADEGKATWVAGTGPFLRDAHRVACPYGQPGDRLWARERFTPLPMQAPTEKPSRWQIVYAAGGAEEREAPAGYNPMLYNYERWSPSIHMPRWASRLTLEITGVRVERLQDISRTDAIAEGLDHVSDGGSPWGIVGLAPSWSGDPRKSYRALWESINGPGSWDANPWVWVIEFRRIGGGR